MSRQIIISAFLTSILANGQQKETAESLLEEGIKLQYAGKQKEAIGKFNRSLYLNPGLIEAYAARAASKEQLNDFNGAHTDLNSCLELQPDQYEVLLSRGSLRFRMGRYPDAREDFQKLLILPHGETNSVFYRRSAHGSGTDQILTAQSGFKSQVYNYLGLIEVQLHNCQKGIIYLDSALKLNKNDADCFVNRALAKQSCLDKTANEDFQKALAINPDHPIAQHNLAVESARQGSFDDAEKQLTEVINKDSTFSYPYIERGYYRLMRANYTGALADYNQALRLNPKDPEIWLSRGIVKEKLNDLAGAYSDYTQAIELKEDFVKAWLNRGNLFVKQGKFREAIEDYSSAITFQQDYALAYYNRGIAYYRTKAGKEACEDLKQAERLGFEVEQRMLNTFCNQSN